MEDGPNGSTDSGEYKVADMTDVIREKKKRPRRKLCYLTNKKSSSKQWKDKLSLEDIDGMFDDLDSSSPGNDISPLQDTDESDQSKRGISPVLQKRSLIVKLPAIKRPSLQSFQQLPTGEEAGLQLEPGWPDTLPVAHHLRRRQEDPSLAHRMHSVRSINQDPAGLHDDPVQPVSDAAALSKHQRIDDSIPGPGRFQPVLLFQPPTSPLTTTGHGR
ncbi:uncharacterized protein LOC114842178 isoform X3 [Betta splendens]|uniref:Uncharacterized protein LOC114842178 isoform X3 n=1 Tax=Betta splendens TaxID=158456 RepID=A0A6P7KM38_BETSP|nr:uncharacterized protein LOC114842178 isoform X3 [Betta splendens]